MSETNDTEGLVGVREKVRKLELRLAYLTGGIAVLAVLSFLLPSVIGKAGPKGDMGVPGQSMPPVPVGSIVAWAGPIPHPDSDWHQTWKVCDGGSVNGNDALWQVLMGLYTNKPTVECPDSIFLPDFRGVFLRGEGAVANLDPKRASEDIGTMQLDLIGSHAHDIASRKQEANHGGGFAGRGFESNSNPDGKKTNSSLTFGGVETRPVNLAVHWVIRFQ